MRLFSFFILAVLLFVTSSSYAQDKTGKFEKIVPADFAVPVSPAIDSNTNAVILADYGITTFKGNTKGWLSYVFKRKTRILITSKKAFDLATVKMRLYKDGDDKEKVESLTATTYNLENGAVVATKMDKTDLFSEQVDKNYLEQKFTLPAVKENSIIEYSYTIISDFTFNIPEWEFQNRRYPCLWSEYEVAIPSLLNYVFTKTGVHSFFIDKGSEGHENYAVRRQHDVGLTSNEESLSVSAQTVKHRWVMKDVPAFFVENYLFTAENYIDKIDFQLSQTYDGESFHDVKNSWRKLNDDLLHDPQFAGFVFNQESGWWLDKPLETIVGNTGDQLVQAKNIFYFVNENFTCTDHYRVFVKTSLQNVFKARKGAVGEINLLLTQMLLRKNIKASPVLLSTRELGVNIPSYPILSKLNYVICRATIDNKVYYLDASQPHLGFGALPPQCYNGHARVIDKEDSASVYFMPDSLKEFETTMINIISPEGSKGPLEGVYEKSTGPIGAFELRQTYAGVDEKTIVAGMQKNYGDDIEITSASIDSLKRLEDPVKLRINFKFKEADNSDILYFSPVMWSEFKQNPFQAAVRKYPIEMSYPVHQLYVMNMETPPGYVIEELPKSARVSFNDGEGSFEYLIQKNEFGFQLRTSVYMKKAYFSAADYSALREFFGFVVKKQNEQIVFKKKK